MSRCGLSWKLSVLVSLSLAQLSISSTTPVPSSAVITSGASLGVCATAGFKTPVGTYNQSVIDNALSCYYEYSSYLSSLSSATSASDYYNSTSVVVDPNFVTLTTTIYPSNGTFSTYTLCDGSPRANINPVTSTWVNTTLATMTETWQVPSGTVRPSCSISPEGCRYLYYNTNASDVNDAALLAMCGSPAHLCQPCLIQGGPVQLVYFPVTTTGGNLCAHNGTTVHPNVSGTAPVTAVALGTTLTSGSVYLSFDTIYAYWDGFGDRVGTSFSNTIIPFPSSAISSQCGGWWASHGPGTQLNYADFQYPVAASAYKCANRCATQYPPPPECSTIWSDFNPILAVPTEIRNLDPAWASCSFYDDTLPNFVFDPPIALTPVAVIAQPTIAASATTQPASPAPTVQGSFAAQTQTSQTTIVALGATQVLVQANGQTTTVVEASATTTSIVLSDGATLTVVQVSSDATATYQASGKTTTMTLTQGQLTSLLQTNGKTTTFVSAAGQLVTIALANGATTTLVQAASTVLGSGSGGVSAVADSVSDVESTTFFSDASTSIGSDGATVILDGSSVLASGTYTLVPSSDPRLTTDTIASGADSTAAPSSVTVVFSGVTFIEAARAHVSTITDGTDVYTTTIQPSSDIIMADGTTVTLQSGTAEVVGGQTFSVSGSVVIVNGGATTIPLVATASAISGSSSGTITGSASAHSSSAAAKSHSATSKNSASATTTSSSARAADHVRIPWLCISALLASCLVMI